MLHGAIQLNKRIRKHPVWLREPKCYASAWADLLLLANDQERTVFIRGEPVALKRGQLAWSKASLEEEWGRSDAWVKGFLNFCQEQTMITMKAGRRGTIITVLNYDAYNPVSSTESDTDVDTESSTESDTDLEQKQETGIRKRELGKVEGPAAHKSRSFSGAGTEKNRGPQTAAQALFLVDRELDAVKEEIATLDELVQPVPAELKRRRDDLQKKRGEILTQ